MVLQMTSHYRNDVLCSRIILSKHFRRWACQVHVTYSLLFLLLHDLFPLALGHTVDLLHHSSVMSPPISLEPRGSYPAIPGARSVMLGFPLVLFPPLPPPSLHKGQHEPLLYCLLALALILTAFLPACTSSTQQPEWPGGPGFVCTAHFVTGPKVPRLQTPP